MPGAIECKISRDFSVAPEKARKVVKGVRKKLGIADSIAWTAELEQACVREAKEKFLKMDRYLTRDLKIDYLVALELVEKGTRNLGIYDSQIYWSAALEEECLRLHKEKCGGEQGAKAAVKADSKKDSKTTFELEKCLMKKHSMDIKIAVKVAKKARANLGITDEQCGHTPELEDECLLVFNTEYEGEENAVAAGSGKKDKTSSRSRHKHSDGGEKDSAKKKKKHRSHSSESGPSETEVTKDPLLEKSDQGDLGKTSSSKSPKRKSRIRQRVQESGGEKGITPEESKVDSWDAFGDTTSSDDADLWSGKKGKTKGKKEKGDGKTDPSWSAFESNDPLVPIDEKKTVKKEPKGLLALHLSEGKKKKKSSDERSVCSASSKKMMVVTAKAKARKRHTESVEKKQEHPTAITMDDYFSGNGSKRGAAEIAAEKIKENSRQSEVPSLETISDSDSSDLEEEKKKEAQPSPETRGERPTLTQSEDLKDCEPPQPPQRQVSYVAPLPDMTGAQYAEEPGRQMRRGRKKDSSPGLSQSLSVLSCQSADAGSAHGGRRRLSGNMSVSNFGSTRSRSRGRKSTTVDEKTKKHNSPNRASNRSRSRSIGRSRSTSRSRSRSRSVGRTSARRRRRAPAKTDCV